MRRIAVIICAIAVSGCAWVNSEMDRVWARQHPFCDEYRALAVGQTLDDAREATGLSFGPDRVSGDFGDTVVCRYEAGPHPELNIPLTSMTIGVTDNEITSLQQYQVCG